MYEPLEIRRLSPKWEKALAKFFSEIQYAGISEQFHPHPFTADHAKRIACYQGRDLYYVLVDQSKVLGYGMLRGWDEGYTVPSLGIVLGAEIRGMGLGETFLRFLHNTAARCGASRVRLKVYPSNTHAIRLYRKLGYVFSEALEAGQNVGHVELSCNHCAEADAAAGSSE